MNEPAYTPRTEFECDGSTTHYQGCRCHEARRNAEMATVTEQRDLLLSQRVEELHYRKKQADLGEQLVEENKRLREALEAISTFDVPQGVKMFALGAIHPGQEGDPK